MKKFLLTATVAALGSMSMAAPALADDTQAWGTVNVSVGLGGPFKASSETVLRTSDAKGFYELEENLMVGADVAKDVTVWLGYTHNPNYSHGNFTVMERRFRQQVEFGNIAKFGAFKLAGRVRLEERWREGISSTGWRLRPQVKISTPLGPKTSLTLSNEQFFELNKNSFQKTGGLQRMRTALELKQKLSKQVAVKLGYLEQHAFVRNGPDTDDHVLTVGLDASF